MLVRTWDIDIEDNISFNNFVRLNVMPIVKDNGVTHYSLQAITDELLDAIRFNTCVTGKTRSRYAYWLSRVYLHKEANPVPEVKTLTVKERIDLYFEESKDESSS